MAVMNMIQALNDAHKVAMRADEDIVVFGEDAGFFGGVFRVTEGLQKEFGKTRAFDAPISENGIVATAIGSCSHDGCHPPCHRPSSGNKKRWAAASTLTGLPGKPNSRPLACRARKTGLPGCMATL